MTRLAVFWGIAVSITLLVALPNRCVSCAALAVLSVTDVINTSAVIAQIRLNLVRNNMGTLMIFINNIREVIAPLY